MNLSAVFISLLQMSRYLCQNLKILSFLKNSEAAAPPSPQHNSIPLLLRRSHPVKDDAVGKVIKAALIVEFRDLFNYSVDASFLEIDSNNHEAWIPSEATRACLVNVNTAAPGRILASLQ